MSPLSLTHQMAAHALSCWRRALVDARRGDASAAGRLVEWSLAYNRDRETVAMIRSRTHG